jgi:hypothetical protein
MQLDAGSESVTWDFQEDVEASLERQIADRISERQTVAKKELELEFRKGLSDRDWGLLLWRAREVLEDQGLTIAAKRGTLYVTDAKQALRRSSSHRRTGYRKMERSVRAAWNASMACDDDLEKRRAEGLALKTANALVAARLEMRRAMKPRPKGL